MKRRREITLREHLESIARKGGLARTEKKLKASKRNLRKALHKRFPHDPRWMDRKKKSGKGGDAQ